MEHPEYTDVKIQGCTLVMTCGSCPEQYNVFHDAQQIGYLRLRSGEFRADYGSCGGAEVYSAQTEGDGCFEDHEREKHLYASVAALVAHHNAQVST